MGRRKFVGAVGNIVTCDRLIIIISSSSNIEPFQSVQTPHYQSLPLLNKVLKGFLPVWGAIATPMLHV